LSFFPEYKDLNLDPQTANLTIRHLLTMTTGFDYQENRTQSVYGSQDWIAATLSLGMKDTPGTTYNYMSPAAHLLAGVLSRATGMPCHEFAKLALFQPLSLEIAGWASDPLGNVIGGSEMYFTTRDMARFGLLFLHKGKINDNNIISADWIAESTSNHSKPGDPAYGYFWMPVSLGGHDAYAAAGHGGQFIINVPELNLIVVTTANPNFPAAEANQHANAIVKLIANDFLPAVSAEKNSKQP
jgi:CubicO group peptidase (beta-lactamase class C family)